MEKGQQKTAFQLLSWGKQQEITDKSQQNFHRRLLPEKSWSGRQTHTAQRFCLRQLNLALKIITFEEHLTSATRT